MTVPWLLIALLGLAANEVSCQTDESAFADPPLPTAGMLLCIYSAYCTEISY